jgi:hypothetical protein
MTNRNREDQAASGDLPQETTTPTTAERANFARRLARTEFGRHYWDDRMTEELHAAAKRKRKKRT